MNQPHRSTAWAQCLGTLHVRSRAHPTSASPTSDLPSARGPARPASPPSLPLPSLPPSPPPALDSSLARGAGDLLRLRLRLHLRGRGNLGRLPVQHDFRLLEVAAGVCGRGRVSGVWEAVRGLVRFLFPRGWSSERVRARCHEVVRAWAALAVLGWWWAGVGAWNGVGGSGGVGLTFVDQDQAEIVPRRVFFVHVSEGGGEVEAS
jgi:hypothetical protein